MMKLLTVHVLFSLSALQVACQAPPSPSVVGTTVKSLPNPLVIPSANVNYTCTTSTTWLPNAFSPTWIPDTFSPSDCAEAIAKFHDIEVAPKRDTVYEFIQTSAPQSRPYYYGQATPRQYISGRHMTCCRRMFDGLTTSRELCHGYCQHERFTPWKRRWSMSTPER